MAKSPHIPVVCLAFANERTETGFLRGLSLELKAILSALEPAVRAGKIELKILPAATASEIANTFQEEWLEGRIRVFHYAGHADGDELWLEGEQGGNESFSSMGLARFLGAQDSLQFVFLNGCATQDHADLLLAANIPSVVVTSEKINDDQARKFGARFYKGLASGAHLLEAFTEGEAFILGNTQNVQEDINRGLYWKKEDEKEQIQFPWRMFHQDAVPGKQNPEYWRLFGGLLNTDDEVSEAEAISRAFIGQVFGSYKVVKLLGVGSKGMVFKAIHETFHDEVAIKITHRILEGFENVKRILVNGNKVLYGLRHPNLGKVIDAGPIGKDYMYVIMELIKGERLDQVNFQVPVLDERGIDQLISHFIQLADGLRVAHHYSYIDDDGKQQNGIAHGNLRPSKVLFTLGSVPKIIDFLFTDLGRARGVKFLTPSMEKPGAEDAEKKPRSQHQHESPEDYLPPEVIRGSKGIGTEADVYALGAVMLRSLTGLTIPQVGMITEEKIRSLISKQNSKLPEGLALAIYRAIHPDPSKRTLHIEGFQASLQASLTEPEETVNAVVLAQAEEKDDLNAIINSLQDRVLSGYRILRYLGVGRLGMVFEAGHETTGEKVALKLTHRILKGYDRAEYLFKKNAEALQYLSHPSVAQIKEVNVLGNQEYFYILRELVHGTRLDKVKYDVPNMRRSDLRDLLVATIRLCEGLEAAHGLEYVGEDGSITYGIMHGNLHRRKVFLTEDGHPKIIDFLLGELINDPEILIATPKVPLNEKKWTNPADFLPPEVVQGRQKPSKRSDVFSLGAIFYEILTGRELSEYLPTSPFMMAKLLDQSNPRIPRKIAATIFNAIHPEPYKRYNNVTELKRDILRSASIIGRLWVNLK
ncbi:MAG: protein kinase [Bacteroidia bacterium]